MWHYAKDGAAIGPVSIDEMSELIAAGTIDPNTLVWREGMTVWTPAFESPDLNSLVGRRPPPLPAETARANLPVSFEIPQPARPWPRFWARTLDITLTAIIIFTGASLLALFFYPQAFYWLERTNDSIVGLAALPITLTVLAMIMAITGSTLGKYLFGIRVHKLTRQPSIVFFAQREAQVWVKGLALGIPIVALFTYGSQFKRVNAGLPASYDDGAAFVEGVQVRLWRKALGWTLLGLSLAVSVWLVTLSKETERLSRQTREWLNPITGQTAALSALWTPGPFEQPADGQVFYFAHDNGLGEALIGIEPAPNMTVREYAEAIQRALSQSIEFEREWDGISIAGNSVLQTVARLASDNNVEIEISVAVKDQQALRTLVFARGRSVASAPDTGPFVGAVFGTF